MVFDDTFEHEVHNDTEETRVVLLVDVLRPMGLAGRLLTRTLTTLGKRTAYVQDAKRNNALFESRMRETADALFLLNN